MERRRDWALIEGWRLWGSRVGDSAWLGAVSGAGVPSSAGVLLDAASAVVALSAVSSSAAWAFSSGTASGASSLGCFSAFAPACFPLPFCFFSCSTYSIECKHKLTKLLPVLTLFLAAASFSAFSFSAGSAISDTTKKRLVRREELAESSGKIRNPQLLGVRKGDLTSYNKPRDAVSW